VGGEEEDGGLVVAAGTNIPGAAKQGLRLTASSARAIARASKLPLEAATSANAISRPLRQLGYKVRPHFTDRLRGVGPSADYARMGALGLNRLGDVIRLLNLGTKVVLPGGRVGIHYGQAKVILESDLKTLITVMHRGS